jgi:phage terminase small subunit
MTPKQQRFVQEYLVDLDATKAARRTGYKGAYVNKTAHELMGKPEIQAAIAKAQAERAVRVEDDADQVLTDLRRLGDAAEHEKKYDAAIRTVELRGKHLGMFKDRVEHTGKDGGPILYDRITREIIDPRA